MVSVPQWFRRLLCGSRIDELQQEIDNLEATVDELQPPEYPKIDYETADRILVAERLDALGGWGLREEHYWLDNQYRLPTKDDFETYAILAAGELPDYHDEFYDCEDFAFAFMSMMAKRVRVNGVGVIISPPPEHHAFNVVVCQETVELWEPNGSEYLTDSEEPKYSLDGAWWLI